MEDSTTKLAVKSLVRGGIFSFTGIVIHQAAGIGLRIVLARWLTPEEFGIVNLGLAVMIMAGSISLMGYGQGITRFTAFFNGRCEKGKTKASVVSVLKFTALSGCLVGLFIYVFSRNISVSFFHNKALISVLKVFALAIPFFALAKALNGGLRGLKKINLMIITDNILWRVLPLIIFPFLFVFCELRSVGAAYSFLFTVIIMCIIAGVFLWKEIRGYPNISDTKTCFKEITEYSWPLALVNVSNQVKNRADIFILGFFLGTVEVGIFAVAATMTSVLNIFLHSMLTIFNPVASELYGQESSMQIARIFSFVTKWLVLAAFPVLLFLVFFAEVSITCLFGEAYKAAAPALVILSICFFAKTAVGPAGSTLLAMGHSRINMLINALAMLLGILLNLLLIPRHGIIGAAIATGIAALLQQVGMLYMVRKHITFPLGWFRKTMVVYAGYCIVLILFVKIYLEESIQSVLSLALISLIFYVLALLGIVVTKQLERDDFVLIGMIQRKARASLSVLLKFVSTGNDRHV